MIIFWGMKILLIFFFCGGGGGGHHNIGLYLEVISMHFRGFRFEHEADRSSVQTSGSRGTRQVLMI